MTAIQCQPKRTVKFYGPLAKALKRRSFSAVGLNSASEVMRCLLSNFPQLGSHMRERHYRVVMNGRAISKDELDDPVGDNHEIHIIPAICGAGGGPLTSILTGVALIGAGLLFPFAAPFLTPLGIGLALQGVAQLISPTPNDTPESTDPSDRSYNFSNIQQTSREGVPVPLVYGDIVTGSVVLSVNIEEDEEELGAGAGAGAGAGDAAGEANALFEDGPGNPNPDPNPVPDESTIVVPSGNLRSTWVISASGTVYTNNNDHPACTPAGGFPSNIYLEFIAGIGPGPHVLVQTKGGSFTLGTAYTSTGCPYLTTSRGAGYLVSRPEYEVHDANGNVIASFAGNYPTSWAGGAHPISTVWGFVTPVLVSYEQV